MTPQPPHAEVKPYNGAPALFINGKPHCAMSYMTYNPDEKHFKGVGDEGIHVYSFAATPTQSTFQLSEECWTGPDTFDYAQLDERVKMILDNDPEAYMFPRLYLGTPQWWCDDHEDDLTVFETNRGQRETAVVAGNRVASCASDAWRQDTAVAIRKLIQHVEASAYADRIIGYHIAGLMTEEWMQWGDNDDNWGDYSPVNMAKFQSWLRDTYETEAALQSAWRDDTVTFETATIPSFEKRAKGEMDYLRDPAQAQDVIDYILYNSWIVADSIGYFASVVKDETERKRLAGAFYGYVLLLAGVAAEQNHGHLALRQAFSNADLDFFTSPSSYAFRDIGTGFCHAMAPIETIKLHNKLWFDENDYRTWLTPRIVEGQIYCPGTYEGTLLQQKREFAWVLTNRIGMWWFDMSGGWYHDQRMLHDLGQMNRIAEQCIGVDGVSTAEIAFVVDGKSSAYIKPNNAFSKTAVLNQLLPLSHAGAAFDMLHLADLDRARPYKLYIFPNCLAPSADERRSIKEKVIDAGAATIWIGPAGIYRDGAYDESAMQDLTGMPLKYDTEHKMGWFVGPRIPEAIEWGWKRPERFGHESVKGLVAYCEPGFGTVLGYTWVSGHVGVVADEPDGRLNVFCGVPPMPESLLRTIALKAGVHCHADEGDIVWATKDLLAVSVTVGGKRTIRLPQTCRVTDLWTGECLAENAIAFEVRIGDGDTALFRTEPR